MGKTTKLIRKLVKGDFDELRDRAREEWVRREERRHCREKTSLFDPSGYRRIFLSEFLERYSSAGDTIDFAASLRSRDSTKFFPGFMHAKELKQFITAICPHENNDIIHRADQILNNHFPVFNLGFISYGDPPQWNYDPILKIKAPERFYGDIAYLDPAIVGDSKVIWELSRFQFVDDLGQAYVLTEDEKYPSKFFQLIHDWSKHNRDFHGINFCSALESAFRIHSLAWGIFFFKDSPSLTDDFARDLYRIIHISVHFLENHLSRFFSPNTHLLGEAYGLYLAGLLFPEFADAPRWERLGLEILTGELDKQITKNGMHAELSTAYHGYAIEFYLSAVILSERTGRSLPQKYYDKLRQMTNVLAALQRPDGTWPHLGDEDGGRLYFLSRPCASDFRPLLEVCNVFLAGREGKQQTSRHLETFWLTGANQRSETIQESDHCNSTQLESSGLIVSRSANGRYSLFQCGKFGYGDSPHSHADILHLDVSVGDDNFLIDPGTYVYTGDRKTRDRFRSATMHNGPTIAGLNLMNLDDPFGWLQKPDCQINSYFRTSRSEFYQASYKVDIGRGASATLSRSVLFLHDQMWVIFDTMHADTPVQLMWNFITPSEVVRTADAIVLNARSNRLRLIPGFPEGVKHEVRIEDCGISDDYLSTYGGKAVRIATASIKGVTAVFLFLPCKENKEVVSEFTIVENAGRICLIANEEQFTDYVIFGASRQSTVAKITTDASYAYLRSAQARLQRAVIVDGSFVKLNSNLIVQSRMTTRFADIVADGSMYSVESPDHIEINVPSGAATRVVTTQSNG